MVSRYEGNANEWFPRLLSHSWDGGEPNNERAFLFALGEEEDCVEMHGRVAYMWNDARSDKTRW